MFLKFGHTARPVESLKEINLWYQEGVKLRTVEGTPVMKTKKVLRLRLEFSDGSAWSFDLPDGIDRERFLERFCREINRRVVTDVSELVEKLKRKEAGK